MLVTVGRKGRKARGRCGGDGGAGSTETRAGSPAPLQRTLQRRIGTLTQSDPDHLAIAAVRREHTVEVEGCQQGWKAQGQSALDRPRTSWPTGCASEVWDELTRTLKREASERYCVAASVISV